MDTNNDDKTILQRLDSVELKMLQEDVEYAKQCLIEQDVDVEEEKELAAKYINKIKFMVKAISNKQQDQKLLEIAIEKVKAVIQENIQKTSDILIELLQSKTPAVQYRNLDSWTDDEIRDILADVDLVKLMEELNKMTD